MPRPPPSPQPVQAQAHVPVSIAAVAQRAGVSIATVSRVINAVSNKASAETVVRVREAIDALGYRPMGAGRSLRRGKSRLVAVLAANLMNPAMAAIAAAAEAALRTAGYVMVLCDTWDQADLQDEYLLEMRAQYACGFVLLGAVESRVLASFHAAGEPMVFVNRRNPAGEGRFVGIDNLAAGAEVARWLLARGVRLPALIHGSLKSSATADRVEGFVRGLREAGVTLPVKRKLGPATQQHLDKGYEGMRRLLLNVPVPDAVFCTSDLIAYGARRAVVEAQAVERMQIMGFDDSPLNPWIAPWLHTVRVPYDQYGAAIVDVLGAGEARAIVLDYALVEGSA